MWSNWVQSFKVLNLRWNSPACHGVKFPVFIKSDTAVLVLKKKRKKKNKSHPKDILQFCFWFWENIIKNIIWRQIWVVLKSLENEVKAVLTNCGTVLVLQYKITKVLISHHPQCMMQLKELSKNLYYHKQVGCICQLDLFNLRVMAGWLCLWATLFSDSVGEQNKNLTWDNLILLDKTDTDKM